jgi:hypothetical protein
MPRDVLLDIHRVCGHATGAPAVHAAVNSVLTFGIVEHQQHGRALVDDDAKMCFIAES